MNEASGTLGDGGVFQSRAVTPSMLLGKYSNHRPDYQARTLKVPLFQRPFRWEKEQIRTFWEDIYTFFKNDFARQYNPSAKGILRPYFLGPIVLMPKPREAITHVLDGQQRLSVITLALTALRSTCENLAVEVSDEELKKDLGEKARDITKDYLHISYTARRELIPKRIAQANIHKKSNSTFGIWET